MMTQEEFMDVVALRRQRWTITDIAAEVGRHTDTVAKAEAGGPSVRRQVAETVIDDTGPNASSSCWPDRDHGG
jgi:hypothetical protein